MVREFTIFSLIAASGLLLLGLGCASLERKLLFFPTHRSGDNGLEPWTYQGAVIGYAPRVASPRNVWLMIHGNGGQASDRAYALPSFSPRDSVYILEYPGYGSRPGRPSKESFNQAAKAAYLFLRETMPGIPVCALGESIGSGPACALAGLPNSPDKVVLVVPFDRLSLVAKDHFPSWIVSLMLTDDWDNVAALAKYRGPTVIFGAQADTIIPIDHARSLAASIPSAKFVIISGGHNDWSQPGRVQFEGVSP